PASLWVFTVLATAAPERYARNKLLFPETAHCRPHHSLLFTLSHARPRRDLQPACKSLPRDRAVGLRRSALGLGHADHDARRRRPVSGRTGHSVGRHAPPPPDGSKARRMAQYTFTGKARSAQ